MAIDQEIQRKVDAYRSNPQALQQRYAQNQQLIDLLALQKLKSEKDAAAKQMQLQMAQNPQTIKQQRERELLDRTKQEMMQQQAGIMQTAQQRQQQNIQRVANQGVASLGGQQRPPVARMAGGGIVAFQEGGATTPLGRWWDRKTSEWGEQNDLARLRERVRGKYARYGAPIGMLKGQSDEQRAYAVDIIDRLNSGNVSPEELRELDAQFSDFEQGIIPEGTSGGDSAPSAKGTSDEALPQKAPIEEPPQPPAQDAVPSKQPTAADQSRVSGIDTLTAPKIDLSNVGQMGESILERTGLGSIQDPNKAQMQARDEAATYMGRQRVADRMQDYLKQLGALDAQQTDPAKLRREEFLAGLRGAANTGSFGGTMAGVSRGMAEERKAQEKSQRDRLLKTIELDQAAMGLDIDMAKTALGEGRSANEQIRADRRIAAQVLSTMSSAEVRARTEQAKMKYNANQDNIKNTLEKIKIDVMDSYKRAVLESDKRTAAFNALQKISSDIKEVIQDTRDTDKQVQMARIALKSLADKKVEETDPRMVKAKQALKDAIKAQRFDIYAQLDMANILDIQEQLQSIIDGNDLTNSATEATDANWGDVTVRQQ